MIPEIVNGIYYQFDELRQLYGSEYIEEILAGIIDRKKRLNRLVELKSKGMLTVEEHHEIEYVERVRQQFGETESGAACAAPHRAVISE